MPHKKLWVFAALILILLLVNFSIYQKEQHLAHGRTVCLRLAPVDPRSLMQGDYMRLRFALANTLRAQLNDKNVRNADGKILVHVDTNCTATFAALYHGQARAPDQMLLSYRIRNGRIKIATNAFFFQEGTGTLYEEAAYGVFKVNEKGEPLLVELKDMDLQTLKPPKPKE